MKESAYLQQQLSDLSKTRNDLPTKFVQAQKQVEQHIDQLMRQANIYDDVQKAKNELDNFRVSLQRQADILTGKIDLIQHLFDTYHRDPVEEGTMLHGIDISKLDWQTRLMVREGNPATIAALGGFLESPAVVPPSESEVIEQPAESYQTIEELIQSVEV